MPRVEAYGGDRVQTRPRPGLRRSATPPVPTAAVFGGQFGETLGHVADVATQIHDEQQKRANDHFVAQVDTQLNQLYQIQGLSADRGPNNEGVKGLFNMTGMEPHDKLEANLKDYDAQADEIKKQAKNPDQRLLAERMVSQARDRYVDSAMRHASSEYAKAETGQQTARLNSSINLAGAAAGTPGGDEVIEEQKRNQFEIIWFQGDKLGLHTADEKRAAVAEAWSKTHVLAINKLISSDKDREAQAYFDRVMTPSPGYPQGEIDPQEANALREKLDVNTTEAQGYQDALAAWKKFDGPKPGDANKAVRTAEMLEYLNQVAGNDRERYKAGQAYVRDMEQAIEGQRSNQQDEIKGTLYNLFYENVSMPVIRESAAWKNASQALRSEILHLNHERDRQKVADQRSAEANARARASEARERMDDPIRAYNRDQALRAINGNAAYYRLADDPQQLQNMSRGALQQEIAKANLSEAQRKTLLDRQEQLKTDVNAAAGATADRTIFKQEAYRAGLTYVYSSGLNKDQEAALGSLQSEVDVAIATEELAQSKTAARRVRLGVEEQRRVMRTVIANKVLVDRGFFGGGTEEMTAALVVNAEDQATARIPIASIHPDKVLQSITLLRSFYPWLANQTDEQIRQRYQRPIERSHAATAMRLGPEEELKRLRETP